MDVHALIERLKEAAKRAGFTGSLFGHQGEFPLIVFERVSAGARAHVYLSAGVHGDEPAGPMALLELFRRNAFRQDVAFSVVPVINPMGLELGTRENGDGVDLNRCYGPNPGAPETLAHQDWLDDRRFDLALCLHEDYEAKGFYLYELSPAQLPATDPRSASMRSSPARALLERASHFLPIDRSPMIDEMPNDEGLMQPPEDRFTDWVEGLPEAIHLLRHHTPWCFTTETPSRNASIMDRIACQCAVVEAAVDWVSGEP